MTKPCAVILAAGLSVRMGSNKLLLPLGHSTVLKQFLHRFPFDLFGKVIVVYSKSSVAKEAEQFPVELCKNQSPETGQSHSIQLGLKACRTKNAVMFLVADQPLLQPPTIEKLIRISQKNPGHIVLPEVNGTPRNPVVFPPEFHDEINILQGDCGGREVLKNNPGKIVRQSFHNADEFLDIDTDEMYRRVVNLWK